MIRARVFGQRYYDVALSQGDNVEGIEPILMKNKMEEKIKRMMKLYSKEY